MADILREIFGLFNKRYRDMGDGTHAEVVAIGGTIPVSGGLTNTELRAAAVDTIVESYAVPTGAPIVGQAVIAGTGTAVRLVADSLPLPGGSVLLWADTDNTDAMTAGKTGLGNEADGTGDGVVVPKSGIPIIVFADDLHDVWVNGTAADWLSYSAG